MNSNRTIFIRIELETEGIRACFSLYLLLDVVCGESVEPSLKIRCLGGFGFVNKGK